MNLQTIKSIDGKIEYVLLPVDTYRLLKKQIDQVTDSAEDYIPFELEDYVQNPVALARIRADLTQEELAERLKVSQAYISKIESKLLAKIMNAIKKKKSTKLRNSNGKKNNDSGKFLN
jgi:ribosome-binding protein aMBF1 (putative translation factor)